MAMLIAYLQNPSMSVLIGQDKSNPKMAWG